MLNMLHSKDPGPRPRDFRDWTVMATIDKGVKGFLSKSSDPGCRDLGTWVFGGRRRIGSGTSVKCRPSRYRCHLNAGTSSQKSLHDLANEPGIHPAG